MLPTVGSAAVVCAACVANRGLCDECSADVLPQMASGNFWDRQLGDHCPDCIRHQGLCVRHTFGVLPQLRRNIAWLKLIGNAAVEQKARQTVKPTRHVSPEGKAHAQRKATARQTARSKRRGMFGLLRALAQR